MNTERPTPETDAQVRKENPIGVPGNTALISTEFARRLERERDVARENTKAWHGEYRSLNDLHRELGLEHKKALRQLDESRENLTKACEDEHRMAQDLAILTVDRAEVIKQRDRLLEALEAFVEEQCEHRPNEYSNALGAARAAIAEVEGGR